MTSSTIPVYCLPNSRLDVQLARSTVVRHFTVIRPIMPFTVAQVLVVRDKDDPLQGDIILKVYDPRTLFVLRKETKRAWDPQLEARAVELRRMKSNPDDLTLPQPGEVETPEEYENVAWLHARIQYLNEVKAYKQLVSLQGKGVPRLLGHGTLTPDCMRVDPQPRSISLDVLLLERVPNAVAMKEARPSMLRPDLIRSLIDTVSMFPTLGVVHGDANDGNYLFSADRAVVIDFGMAIIRSTQTDAEWEELVEFWNDLGGCKIWIAAKLGVKSLDDHLATLD